jgi:predicted RecB family nuclease
MRLVDGRLWHSPSDLGHFAACEHLTQLEIAAALDEIEKPHWTTAYGELLARKGDEHEAAFLQTLRLAGREVVEIHLGEERDFVEASARTAEAMRAGAAYIYQAVLTLDGWRGIADFLERVDRPSALGAYSYEVLDTKLARRAKPAHALQLCSYSEAVARIQELEPDVAHVVLGTQERETLRLADVTAYYRHIRARFLDAVAQRPETQPFPVDHCDLCDFRQLCEATWERQDHLHRVAGMRRDQIARLATAEITTMAGLAASDPETVIRKLAPDAFVGLREQAELQVSSESAGSIQWRARTIEDGRGFSILPPPSRGDIVLDLEGHPFFEPAGGLEFLFGLLFCDGRTPAYQAIWALARAELYAAFTCVIDLIHDQLACFPDMHVYHFGGYDKSALQRLMGELGLREAEVDDLLRRRIFVNLHSALRQALRVGVRSYSLKQLEALSGFARMAEMRSGDAAVVGFEEWLQTGNDRLLEEIAAYNEEDCRATLALRDWLLAQRPAVLPWPEAIAERELEEEKRSEIDARDALRLDLLEGEELGSPRWLAGELLEYHRREAKPAWWAWFDRMASSPEELVDEPEAIGCLVPVGAPEPVNRSLQWTFSFPEQEHKLEADDDVHDPATGKSAGRLVEVDDATLTLTLLRGPRLVDGALPRALVTGQPYDDRYQRAAVMRVGESVRDGTGSYPALEAILRRDPPRLAGRPPGASIQTVVPAEIAALARSLDAGALFVQGPPGTGKTWRGAEIVVELLDAGHRVGVTAQSHKVIHNLLRAIEHEAVRRDVTFAGLKKASEGNDESRYEGELVTSETAIAPFADPEVRLVAGTAWLFAREELDGTLDYLVIDEAGQVSLADAVAVGTAARNIILLGDPLQLAQVSQGTHPAGAGASVLEHLLAGHPTIPEDRGVFLEASWRMHPDVCTFVSELVYAGRLHSHETAAARSTSLGTGIRYLPVEHAGNRSSAPEEASRIAVEVGAMLGAEFRDSDGSLRPLGASDFMVVTPYNAQIHELRRVLPAGVPVGTVDKFQGQQAPVVFFSMATSSGEDVPRGLTFLFSRNRLNVAISRAQCLAVLVCSPRLLDTRCRTIAEMQLVNALCRLVEVAEAQATQGGRSLRSRIYPAPTGRRWA